MQDHFENWMDAAARELGGEWFDGKVAGVTQPGRQEIIRTLEPCEQLFLDPEPENSYDRNAIALRTETGDQVGYLDRRLAADVTRRLSQGLKFQCRVRCVREVAGNYGVSFGLIQYRR
jgi:hypothetical protein